MKIYMLCDMEGVSGIITPAYTNTVDTGPRARYTEGRRLMTLDISSAAEAAIEAGVDELVVCDTHAGGDNVYWEEMPVDPKITYETPCAGIMLPSLDESFDGLMLLGHHAKAGTMHAFLEHTMSGNLFDYQIDGRSVGEIGIETFYAGHYNVPLVLVQGDAAACAEAEAQFPHVTTACVKTAIRRERASGPHPALARALTAAKVRDAIQKLAENRPPAYRANGPYTVRKTFTRPAMADPLANKPHIRRIDGRTIECTLEDQRDVWRWC